MSTCGGGSSPSTITTVVDPSARSTPSGPDEMPKITPSVLPFSVGALPAVPYDTVIAWLTQSLSATAVNANSTRWSPGPKMTSKSLANTASGSPRSRIVQCVPLVAARSRSTAP